MFATEKRRNLLEKWNRNYGDIFDENIVCVLFLKYVASGELVPCDQLYRLYLGKLKKKNQ